jgi:3'-5' exoribonuclease
MSRLFVQQIGPSQTLDQVFRVADKQLRANKNNNLYFLLRLGDRTGTLTAMMWNARREQFDTFERGDYVHVNGTTQVYNGGLQVIISSLDRVPENTINPADYDPVDREATATRIRRITELLATMQRPAMQALGKALLEHTALMDRFSVAPAAVSHHHAYPGGLMEHSLSMMEMADRVADHYPQLDRDILLFGALFHDIGKTDELAGAGELTYTDRGQLIGHIVIGVQLLGELVGIAEQSLGTPFPTELRWHLEHLVISHHGQLDYGSPKVPVTREAIALSYIDLLDAKLAAVDALIQSDVTNDPHWTNFNPGLGRKLWKGPAGGG